MKEYFYYNVKYLKTTQLHQTVQSSKLSNYVFRFYAIIRYGYISLHMKIEGHLESANLR